MIRKPIMMQYFLQFIFRLEYQGEERKNSTAHFIKIKWWNGIDIFVYPSISYFWTIITDNSIFQLLDFEKRNPLRLAIIFAKFLIFWGIEVEGSETI